MLLALLVLGDLIARREIRLALTKLHAADLAGDRLGELGEPDPAHPLIGGLRAWARICFS